MSEYRFTGPFYNDFEERETVTPPPVQEPVEEPKKSKKKRGFGKTILKTICIALLAGIVGGSAFLGVLYVGHDVFGIGKSTEVITEIQKVEPASDATVANSIDVSHIAEMSMPSVVSITNKGVQEIRSWFGTFQQETSGSGSGIIIGENETELLIVTNYHVVSDSKELSVYFSFDEDTVLEGEKENVVSAKIKGYDSKKDLAVISVQLSDIPNETKGKISIATLGDSSKLKVGEQVVAIGNALGYGQSVTTGIVSALDREVKLTSNNGEVISNLLIQTDAAINPGNSGGALLNMRGEVIGINSAKLAAQEVEGMGYAIPITAVESIIGDLMNKETRDKVDKEKSGYLGVNIISVTAEAAKMYELPVGVYVKSVVEGSTAEKAGIKVGDVIIKIDGSSVASAEELIEALTYYEAGETVELVIKSRESGYEEQSIEVVLGSRKDAGLE
jgi:serine protease Do